MADGVHEIEKGAEVSVPIKVDPLKNSTLETTPAVSLEVRSEAEAERTTGEPSAKELPFSGVARATVGAGFTGVGVGVGVGDGAGVGVGMGDGAGVGVGVGLVDPRPDMPVTTSEKDWKAVVSAPSIETVTV